MKYSKEKIPDHLVDSYKHSRVNRMAAGLRLPRSSHGAFLFSTNFSNTPCLTVTYVCLRTGCRTRSPIDLQHLCCKEINK